MGREAGHDLAVVHRPAVDAVEVLSEPATGQRRGRTHRRIPGRISIEVVHTEEEGISGLPLEPERERLQHCAHGSRLRARTRVRDSFRCMSPSTDSATLPGAGGSLLGTRVLRTEDPRLLTGVATYTADLPFDDLLHAVFVRS